MKKEEIKSIYDNGRLACIDNLEKVVLSLLMYGLSPSEIQKHVSFVFGVFDEEDFIPE